VRAAVQRRVSGHVAQESAKWRPRRRREQEAVRVQSCTQQPTTGTCFERTERTQISSAASLRKSIERRVVPFLTAFSILARGKQERRRFPDGALHRARIKQIHGCDRQLSRAGKALLPRAPTAAPRGHMYAGEARTTSRRVRTGKDAGPT
jgi:hypothetical protein